MKEGWHKDPEDPSQEKWWDGEDWGETRKISRKDNLQEAGRRSSKQDIRPRRRRRGGPKPGNPSKTSPSSAISSEISPSESSSENPPSSPSAPLDPEPPSFSGKSPRKEREEDRPSFVELPSAREGSPRGKDFHDEEDLWAERDSGSDFNDFEDLEELSSGAVAFESFEEITRKESPQKKAPEETPEVPKKKASPKKGPVSSKKELLASSLGSLRKKAEQKKAKKKKASSTKKTPKPPKEKQQGAPPPKKKREKRSRVRSGSSSGTTAAKKMIPVGVGIIIVIAAAAILPGMLAGNPTPPKTLQDRLETKLAEKRKDNRKPYPEVEKCLRQNSSVNSVLQKPNEAGEPEWKAIFIDQSKNYQIVTVTRKSSPAEAAQNARLTASTFITTSSGPYYIQGPIKGIAGSTSSKQLSAYVAELAGCLAKT